MRFSERKILRIQLIVMSSIEYEETTEPPRIEDHIILLRDTLKLADKTEETKSLRFLEETLTVNDTNFLV